MILKDKTIILTGASGFVGHYIARVLLERGAKVVVPMRNPKKGMAFQDPNLEIRQADLSDRDALTQAFAGGDAVIHCAGLISVGTKSKAELIATNQVGMLNVLQAMTNNKISRLVYVSTCNVYRAKKGHRYQVGDATLDWSENPHRGLWYGASKAQAERIALAYCQEHNIDLSIARPHAIYGAYGHGIIGYTPMFLKLMSMPISVKPYHWSYPAVYAGDLAEAMVRMLETDQSIGKIYNVTNSRVVDLPEHIEAWRKVGGKTPSFMIPIPIQVSRQYDVRQTEIDLAWHNRLLEEGYAETLAILNGQNPPHDPTLNGAWGAEHRS